MASIRKRGETSYMITVSCGYDASGNKLVQTKTIKLDKGLTAKQAEKELRRQAALFQEEVEKGTHLDGGKITLAEFIVKWMQDAEKRLQPKTIYEYKGLLDRVLPALGHLKLDKIRPNHLMEFYSNLSEVGLRRDIKHIVLPALKEKMKALGMKQADVADKAGLHPATVMAAVNGSPTSKAAEIAEALGVAVKDIFIPKDKPRPLSSNTIHHYHRFLSSVLTSAVQWQLIFSNPAERVKPPRVEKKEAAHYDEDQAEKVLRLLESEPMKYQCMVALTIFAGLRRGELCALEWNDIDLKTGLLRVCKASQYISGQGTITKDTKNDSSYRIISLPAVAVKMLTKYKSWQNEEKLKLGDMWKKNGWEAAPRLFTQWNGKPIYPGTVSGWFSSFRKKHNLPPLAFHGLRHTNASIMIAQGVDIATVSKRLGHAKPSTTTGIYSHALRRPDKEAAEKLDKLFGEKEDKQKPDAHP